MKSEEHSLILEEIKELRADIRQMYACFVSKSTFWKVFGALFVLIGALAGYVIK